MKKLAYALLLFCISNPVYAIQQYGDQEWDQDPIPKQESSKLMNLTLSTCVWKGDIAQGAYIAIRTYPDATPEQHVKTVVRLLKAEGMEDWYIQKVLDVFQQVYETQSHETSATKVFVNIYNDCVRQTKRQLAEGQKYPEPPKEYF